MANTVQIVVTGTDKSGPAINSATQNIKNVGTVAAGILSANILQGAATRMQQFVSSTVKAASDLGESVNAVGKVFGEEASFVEKWGKDNAASFGLSQRAFNQLVTPMGALLKNTGMSMKDVSTNTIDLTKRAADMASVFNTDVSTALNAIQAGLRGETDPLEQFGVHISAAAVEQEALAESGKKVASALTEQEKATARVNLIMKQTASTAGDFAQTSDQYANSQRIANAEIENAQAELGQVLLPILAKAATAASTLAKAFGSLPGPLQTTVLALAGLAAGFVLLAPKISAAKDLFKGFNTHLTDSESKMGKTAKAAGILGAAFVGLQIVGTIASSFSEKFNPNMEVATEGLLRFAKGAELSGEAARAFNEDTGLLGRSLSAVAGSGFSQSMDKVFDSLGLVGDTVQKAHDKVEAFDGALANLVKSGNADAAFILLQKAAKDANVTLEEATNVMPQYRAALEGVNQSTTNVTGSTNDAKKAVQNLQKEFQDTDPLFAYMDAQKQVKSAQDAYNEAVKKSGKNSQEAKDRLADLAQAAINLSGKAKDAAGSFDGHFSPAARRMLSAAGLTKDEIARLETELRKAKAAAEKLDGTNATVTVTTKYVQVGTGPNKAGYAHGGITGAQSGGMRSNQVMVGEHGREILDLPPGTNVHSNPDTESMLNHMSSSGSGLTINLYVAGSILAERDVVKIIRDELDRGGFRGALRAA